MNESELAEFAIREELRSEAFKQGDASWYLKPKQLQVKKFIATTLDPFVEAGRRFGKTTTVLDFCLEQGNKTKKIIRWCEPWKSQCREIVMTEMDRIQSQVSQRYRWRWSSTDSYYECAWTNSRLYLRGVNDDRGESARGPASDIIVCDELGSWREPLYIINDVLGPQLLTTKGKFIFTGTPPRDQTHSYYDLRDLAEMESRFIQKTVYDQEIVPWEEIEKAVSRAGGWESPTVQREYLCRKVIDPNFSIIPEWRDDFIQEVMPDEYFPFYLKYHSLDTGVRDLSVGLVGFYDFKQARLKIMDEFVINGPKMTTEILAQGMRDKESEHFKVTWEYRKCPNTNKDKWFIEPPQHFRMRRVSDVDLLLINDLSTLHALYFEPTDKGYLEEMVNEVRIWVGNGKLVIDPRCKLLIDTMRYGLWNEKRNDWERSDRLGHCDALASLMYMIRNVDTRTNPIPVTFKKSEDDYFYQEVNPNKKPRDKMKKAFNVYNRIKIGGNLE